MILFEYSTSRAQKVPHAPAQWLSRLTDDYASYNALGAQEGVKRLGCRTDTRRKFGEAQKVQPKGKMGRADGYCLETNQ